MTFRIISIFGLLITYIVIGIALKKNRINIKKWFSMQSKNVITPVNNLTKNRVGIIIKSLLLPFTFFCISLLVITGFIPILIFGKPISTYLLLIHASLAPVFVICLAIIALIWSPKNSFNIVDWETFCSFKSSKRHNKIVLLEKLIYWLIIILTLPIVMSILLSMYPLFGSDIQHSLLNIHRFSTLSFVILSTVYVYLQIIKDNIFINQKRKG